MGGSLHYLQFTFQYGEIKRLYRGREYSETLEFTFQYGEIKSCYI